VLIRMARCPRTILLITRTMGQYSPLAARLPHDHSWQALSMCLST
jgi:hypothetical protein